MSVVNLLISAKRAVSDWRRRERAYAELVALDDHSLADIGIHCSQIGGLVEGVRMPGPATPPISFRNHEKFVRRKEA